MCRCAPPALAPATVDVSLTGPKFEATQRLALDVEPGTSALVKRSFHDLQPGESLVLSRDLLADFIPATGAVTATVAPLGGVDVAGLLQRARRLSLVAARNRRSAAPCPCSI